MGRAPCCDKVGMKKGRWTAEEDDILTKYVQANGEGSWRSLPKNAGLLRCGKSCRLRWINYLRADLKRGNISAEEESLIVKLHASFGNRWSLIASHLPGRTDNEIKNYWNSHLSRKIYSFRGTTNTNNTTKEIPLLQGIIEDPPPKRKGGRTSRWAMKKNKSYAQKILIKTPKQSNVPQNYNQPAINLPPQNNGAVDRDGLHQLPCLEGEKNTHDDMLGPCPEVVINGGEVLGFNDIMDTCALEASGVLRREQEEEERESNNNDVVVINEKGNERGDTGCNSLGTVDPESSSANQSSNGELHSSSSSMASGLEENWDWESVMQLNHHKGQSVSWEQNENLLTWLWDDDEWEKDFQRFEDIDPQKHNAMLSWFSS